MRDVKFAVTGMSCAACQANIEKKVGKLVGVKRVEVSLLSNRMRVEFDETRVDESTIISAVEDIGYGASVSAEAGGDAKSDVSSGRGGNRLGFAEEWSARAKAAEETRRRMKRRLIASVALLVPLMYIAMGHMLGLPVPAVLTGAENALVNAFLQMIIATPILIINGKYFTGGFRALVKRAPNMDSLVALGSAAAFLYGIFSMFRMMYGLGHGDASIVAAYSHELYFESSAMILTLVDIGKYLETKSKTKTSDALFSLVNLSPKTANVIRDGVELNIPATDVRVGEIVVIRPGESIPADGIVTEGRGFVDQSAITGESIPVEKNEGDSVTGATVNTTGLFRFRAERVGDDTALSHIIRMVDEASNTKAPIARIADKVSGVFVPTVIAVAFITGIVWALAGEDGEFALSSAISVLVISCPCALGLATPVAIMVGTGRAAELSILVKSASALETLHRVDTVALDKTGTITTGKPSVREIVPLAEFDEAELVSAVASCESGSEHPLSHAIVEYASEKGYRVREMNEFVNTPGRGVSAVVDGERYFSGNIAFMRENGILRDETERTRVESEVARLASGGGTPIIVARGGSALCIIVIADTIRETSREGIERLKKMGKRVVMITGDNANTAEAIKRELDLDDVAAEVLPGQKAECVKDMQANGSRVAMVGDGINDAPALACADVGIAIGAGTDVAIDSADVVLMKNSLVDVANAVELSRAVVRNIKMNLFWAFFYNVIGIPIAAGVLFPAFGLRLSPMLGAAAMSISSVCVVTNALRLRFFRRGEDGKAAKENITNETGEALPEMKGDDIMKMKLTVEGMMCGHCQAHVKKALEGVDGVSEAVVELESKSATVTLTKDVSAEVLKKVVVDAGYEVTGVEKE